MGKSIGAVSGLFGTAGGASGTGYAAPSFGGNSPINPFDPNSGSPQQVTNSLNQNQDALAQQQALLQALQQQNGIQNQSNVYGQLQGVVNGTGPNPAQAQLAQATGQNVANQAALAAGQRGANANVGLIARQAAQQGTNAQQQAAGQAATLQANQSLNALGQAGTIANTQAGNQINATGAVTTAQQNNQQQLLNALGGYNSTNAGLQANINSANASLANTSMQGQQSLIGGALNGLASAAGGFAQGGVVNKYAMGTNGTVQSGPQSSFGQFINGFNTQPDSIDPQPFDALAGNTTGQKALNKGANNFVSSLFGNNLSGIKGSEGFMPDGSYNDASMLPDNSFATAGGAYDSAPMGMMAAAKGGKVPALVSPGEIYLTPKQVQAVKNGANPLKVGEKIHGKPEVGGAVNSYSNDNVRKNLEVGGVIVPRSETKSKKPEKNSTDFVINSVMKKRRARG